MMAETIDRKRLKTEARELLRSAQVSPKGFTALYLGLGVALSVVDSIAGGGQPVAERGLLGIFVYVLVSLMNSVLNAGFVLYFMAIRRGERAEYLTLFDGFSFVGKVIGLNIVISLFVGLWSMLLVVPGIIASYRYRFALYNLYENPDIGILEALDMSKRQTLGYKGQLFTLDMSYLGWTLLAIAPLLVYLGILYAQLFNALAGGATGVPNAFLVTTGAVVVLSLLSGLWALVVSLFYMPNYQCVELDYFETAKRTSGVGFGAAPESPDGLGGLDDWGSGGV